MRRTFGRLLWLIPFGILAFAVVYGVRAYRESNRTPEAAPSFVVTFEPCAIGRYVCRDGVLLATTGDLRQPATPNEDSAPGAAPLCMFRQVLRCQKACVAPEIPFVFGSDAPAVTQLCDAPESVADMIADAQSFLTESVDRAEVCEADGYAPTRTGIDQCILRTGDRMATGVVVARVRCVRGVAPVLDRSPKLLRRDQAIAVFCNR